MAYKNRRSEMYGMLREYLRPERPEGPFAIPPEYHEPRQELSSVPLQYDSEGRLLLPPKEKLRRQLGRSFDRADSRVLAIAALPATTRTTFPIRSRCSRP